MENDKLLKLVMQTKAKLLLSKARNQVKVEITPEMQEHIPADILREQIRHDMMRRLATELVNNYSGHIQEEANGMSTTKSLDLMVMPTDTFKYIVDETIKLMPLEAIDKIRMQVIEELNKPK